MDEPDDETPLTGTDAKMKELLGLFDAPAFARRGREMEYALERLHDRCRRERDAMLDMVRVRLRQWAGATTGPERWGAGFDGPIGLLWSLSGAPDPVWSDRPASPRRVRAIAGDLVASIERFNRRWLRFLDELPLDAINRMIENYNRFYVLEKECSLGSARVAARHFYPRSRVSRGSLLEDYPVLTVPATKRSH